jgi:hypothetical protein
MSPMLPDLTTVVAALEERADALRKTCPEHASADFALDARERAEVAFGGRLPAVLYAGLLDKLRRRTWEVRHWEHACEPPSALPSSTEPPIQFDWGALAKGPGTPDPARAGPSCEDDARALDERAAQFEKWGSPAAAGVLRGLATTRRAQACAPARASPAAGCDVFGVGVPPASGAFGLPTELGWVEIELGLWRPLGCMVDDWQDRGEMCPAGLPTSEAASVERIVRESWGPEERRVAWFHVDGAPVPNATTQAAFLAAVASCKRGIAEEVESWIGWEVQDTELATRSDSCVAAAAERTLGTGSWGVVSLGE